MDVTVPSLAMAKVHSSPTAKLNIFNGLHQTQALQDSLTDGGRQAAVPARTVLSRMGLYVTLLMACPMGPSTGVCYTITSQATPQSFSMVHATDGQDVAEASDDGTVPVGERHSPTPIVCPAVGLPTVPITTVICTTPSSRMARRKANKGQTNGSMLHYGSRIGQRGSDEREAQAISDVTVDLEEDLYGVY